MAVKIKLKRMGKIRTPQYRIVVADSRTKRDGRAIEEIGVYRPTEEPSYIEVNSERVQHWLSVGAQPTEPVQVILKITGDWQKFKGLPAPEPMKVAAPKTDKKAVFEAAAKEAAQEPKADATTAKAKGKKVEAAKAEAEPVKADAEPAPAEVEPPAADQTEVESASAEG